MNSPAMNRQVAALRQTFQIKRRLRLEFLADLSRLFRQYDVNADDDLLNSLVLAVPGELIHEVKTVAGASRTGYSTKSKRGKRTGKPPQTGTKPPQTGTKPPQTGTKPPQTGTKPPQSGTKPPQSGTKPPQTGNKPPQKGRRPPRKPPRKPSKSKKR